MSKGNKPINAVLEKVLVPKEEQPYRVPDNWIWIRTWAGSDVITGSTPPKKNKSYYGGQFPFIKPAGLEQGKEVVFGTEYLTEEGKQVSRVIPEESILICCIGSIGKVGFNKIECTTNQQINSLVPNRKLLVPKFLYYQSLTIEYQKQLWKRSSATTVSIINKGRMSEIPISLPPLNEQKRIAEKVERLLNKIEEAKRLIEEAKETFELRRAAILDMAFRGALTSKWRQQRNPTAYSETHEKIDSQLYEIPKEWKWLNIGVLTTFVGSGSTPKGGQSVYEKEGIPFIRSQNVYNNKMIIDNISFISEEIHQKMKRSQLKGNETLLNITGASIGRAALLDNNLVPCNINQHVCALRFKEDKIIPELPQYWLNSPFLQRLILDNQTGVTRQGLNYTQIRNLPVPLPPIDEQREILRLISNYLNKESEMDILLTLEKQLDIFKHSILSKAFRGKLGTNDPDDENAIKLLEKILYKQ